MVSIGLIGLGTVGSGVYEVLLNESKRIKESSGLDISIKKILVKEGIPFVPSFLVAFVITFIFGNPLMLLL